MIFAEKLLKLRKKNGWSQEELAELMNVSRQSISKWEGARSIPDFEKLIKLSNLLDVSTDFLLKDEIESCEGTSTFIDIDKTVTVSIEEANNFIKIKEKTSKTVALAIFILIISPTCLFILGAISESSKYSLSENVAGAIGLIIMLILIGIAVILLIGSENKTSKYDYLETDIIETDYGVRGIVETKKKKFEPFYRKFNLLGIILCILSIIPLFIGGLINEDNIILMASMLNLLLFIVGVSGYIFVHVGIIWASYEKILQIEDYSIENKKNSSLVNVITKIYWLIVVAIYLGYSYITNKWEISWVVFVVSGIIFPALIAFVMLKKTNQNTIQ